MKKVEPGPGWPESWRMSYRFDLEEVYGSPSNLGYHYAWRNRYDVTMELISRHVPPGSRILDVAAAGGNFSIALAERGHDVTWNDIRAELAGYVSLKHEHGRLSCLPGNVFELAVPRPFDAVLLGEVIEHVAHPDQLLAAVAKLVRPDGVLVVTTPNGGYFRNGLPRFSDCADPSRFEAVQFRPDADGHIFLLHRDEVVGLAGTCGLSVVEIRLFSSPLTNGHLKSSWVLPYLPAVLVDRVESLTCRLPDALKLRGCVAMAAVLRR